MKRSLIINFLIVTFLFSYGNKKDSLIYYSLPDSVKAVSFLADISVGKIHTKKEIFAGIKTDVVKLSLESDKKGKEIVFEFPPGAPIVANGIGIKKEKGELSWNHDWLVNENYRLMIVTAGDSAGNFSLYSGYIFLPKEKKWKLIGTCKIAGQWNSLKQPAVFYSGVKKELLQVNINETWCQRNSGSWKNLTQKNLSLPVVNLLSHVDSLEQSGIDKTLIMQAINENRTDAKQSHEGIYYSIIKEGGGRQVSIHDTLVAHYKGYLFNDGSVFDETKDKPATFPLKRLIMGWQIGVPLNKVGGKIRIIIPSALAYSIRTRSPKIPPNSILVFEVEVTGTKAPQ